MIRPKPKEVYDNPNSYLDFLQLASDDEFECQFFDRKELPSDPRDEDNFKKKIVKCVSAFANSNTEGGLLVLGVSSTGEFKGINFAGELKVNGYIAYISQRLKNQSTFTNQISFKNTAGSTDHLLLIYVSYTDNAICETNDTFPKAWKRTGRQCIELTGEDRRRLERDKRVVDFELSPCCEYNVDEIDKDVYAEFEKSYKESVGAQLDHTQDAVLKNIGAVTKIDAKYYFTKAGFLFFAKNPRKCIPSAFFRLLKYECEQKGYQNPGKTIFDKDFDGPLPSLIRKIRAFLKESAFFKNYTTRNPEGGFIEEPEYPHIAIDEAVVNAVVHRDYGVNVPIKGISYKDSFIVINPGGIPQSVPQEFNLHETHLESVPRNPQIVSWMRLMKDEKGIAFVRALSEGTRTMNSEMESIQLPSPKYKTNTETILLLFNDYQRRESNLQSGAIEIEKEFSNLFELHLEKDVSVLEDIYEWKRNILVTLKNALINKGWFIDRDSHSRVTAHLRGNSFHISSKIDEIVKFFPAYLFQVKEYGGKLYLCVDYKLELKSNLNLKQLVERFHRSFPERRALVKVNGKWLNGKILRQNKQSAIVHLFQNSQECEVANDLVIPFLSSREIAENLRMIHLEYEFDTKVKEYSLSSKPSASRVRFGKTTDTVEFLYDRIFPIKVENTSIHLDKKSARLLEQTSFVQSQKAKPLTVFHDIKEPTVEFYDHHESKNILDGLTTYGSYDQPYKDIEIIPICTIDYAHKMKLLIDRLQHGQYKYKGSERTFGVQLKYNAVNSFESVPDFLGEIKRLLSQNNDWIGNSQKNRLFLIYVPEKLFPQYDVNSPYYAIKELLFESGIPVQMIDTPTLENPDWKDLNLTLNIISKCGVTPWVLPDKLPDVDFFVGLSYTQQYQQNGLKRILGFANIFNNYGRWKFYNGSAETFDYEERHKYYSELVKGCMESLSLSQTPSLHFHYSARFSKEDIKVILDAARSVRPQGKYTFVWINSTHIVRLYDFSAETDGSLSRGAYVYTAPNQFYLSTTGYNTYKKALGTPKMLEINVRTGIQNGSEQVDIKTIAKHLIYLTKLNWASTQSLCGTPITIKYASDIARLTSRLLERKSRFEIHPALKDTPWFI